MTRRPAWPVWLSAIVAVALLAALAGRCVAGRGSPPPPAAEADWRTFEGSWSATGHRQTLDTESGRAAALVRLSGAVVLTGSESPARGFTAEAIAYYDGHDLTVGRAVWTDARGNRIFSELKGGAPQAGRRATGIITGGTGLYAGVTGDYEYVWQYVVHGDEQVVQGRTVELKGRIRRTEVRP